jgi:hypothetical protein
MIDEKLISKTVESSEGLQDHLSFMGANLVLQYIVRFQGRIAERQKTLTVHQSDC